MGRLVCGQTHKGTYIRLQAFLLNVALFAVVFFPLALAVVTQMEEKEEKIKTFPRQCAHVYFYPMSCMKGCSYFLFSLLIVLAIIIFDQLFQKY